MMKTLILLCSLILSVGQTIAQNPTPTELNDLNKLRAAYPLAQPKATAAEVSRPKRRPVYSAANHQQGTNPSYSCHRARTGIRQTEW